MTASVNHESLKLGMKQLTHNSSRSHAVFLVRQLLPVVLLCAAALTTSAAHAANALLGATVTDTCVACPPDKFGAPGMVVDGDPATIRNLGGGAPGAFTLTVAKPVGLKKVVLMPAMTPSGVVSFEVQTNKDAAGAAATWVSHGGVLSKEWSDKVPVEVVMNPDTSDVRAVKVIIHKSPSWIAMYEIEGDSGIAAWVYGGAGLAVILALAGAWFYRRRQRATA
jgi:hypothetical protein